MASLRLTCKRVLLLLLLALPAHQSSAQEPLDHQALSNEMLASLRVDLLDAWYPVTIDSSYGGFLCDFRYDWQPEGPQNKMIVTQTRHVWTASQAVRFLSNNRYRDIAAHGFRFLRDTMWDSSHGGFYWLRDRDGEPSAGALADEKTAYGNAFAIFALASYFAMSGDSVALQLAQQTFHWLDRHSRDPAHKGYVDRLARDGSWLSESPLAASTPALRAAAWKDQNASIHLLEAFTELYRVWPDSLLRQRLAELLVLIRDVQVTERGYLTLFFQRDWTPISFRDSSAAVREANYFFDHVSFGHDVETAYLLLEAAHALGTPGDQRTHEVARRLVDHALTTGWDEINGGFYYRGYYFAGTDTITIISPVKTWWVQAEGLNALLLFASLYPENRKYRVAFARLWEYIKTYLIDRTHGGWFQEGLDQSPEAAQAPKASIWKVNYHNMRALMNCIRMLRSQHELTREN